MLWHVQNVEVKILLIKESKQEISEQEQIK